MALNGAAKVLCCSMEMEDLANDLWASRGMEKNFLITVLWSS